MTTDSRPPAMTTAEAAAIILKNRNHTIVQMHDHDHMSFSAIGRIYGITRQRAHQICTRTRKKQRKEA